jgi:serpin B
MNQSYVPLNTNIVNDARVLELPYNNKKFSMVIVTPTSQSVQEYAAGLDSAKWQSLMTGLSGSYVDVSMPKFKFSYDKELKDVLSTLGMANAFSDLADFTRISTGGLAISEVKHKAFIEVDEEGTTAAAATSVTFVATAVLPYNFKLDHPFIFAIREMKTGLVLFTGVVNDPTK